MAHNNHYLLQALDKAFDTQADVCKALREVQFDQQLLNKVNILAGHRTCNNNFFGIANALWWASIAWQSLNLCHQSPAAVLVSQSAAPTGCTVNCFWLS